ncbi:hypothetical protein F5887DRAFT_1060348 [Amanita rubescens]|nr:hypothetical protein F5887DRAFT_1060348 [Amanita rubescens]
MPSVRDKQVILVGIGGATCSGKTTLAKHLHRILPNSIIVHQDVCDSHSKSPNSYRSCYRISPLCPQHDVPIHPIHQVQDWDNAAGAIDWPRFVTFLGQTKASGVIPSDHRSHDHLNEQKDIPVSDECRQKWTSEFDACEDITWIIVDGFLLYWHPEAAEHLDTRIFLRVPHDVLKQRRHERHGYHTAAYGEIPQITFENIVYPAYIDAHRDMFENGDVESGRQTGKIDGLVSIDMLDVTMDEAVDRCCMVIREKVGAH